MHQLYDFTLTLSTKAVLSRLVSAIQLSSFDKKRRGAPGHYLVLSLTFLLFSTPSFSQTVWNGSAGSDWANPANWSAGVPDADDDVTIPDVTTDPTISAGEAVAKSISIQSGGVLTISEAGTLKLSVSNDIGIDNYGTVNSFGKITISGVATSGISNHAVFNNLSGQITIDDFVAHGISNSGTFTNTGAITISSAANTGINGVYNTGVFNNDAGGGISVDGTNSRGIWNNIGGIFTNQADITIGATVSTGTWGLQNNATFNNNVGGQINISRSASSGISNIGSGAFSNHATINIGAVASAGSDGITNSANFSNSAGQINIIRVTGSGILNTTGSTFTNLATITFGTDNRGTVSLLNEGNFSNVAGQIVINGTVRYGLWNLANATFTNNAAVTIGSASEAPAYEGIYNLGTINNNPGGRMQIDRSTNAGITNYGTIVNVAEITMGSIASLGKVGIDNFSVVNNNTGGLIKIDGCTGSGITDRGRFVNNAMLKIGGTSSVGASGILAYGSFTNSGEIYIDRTKTSAIAVINNAGKFDNFNTIRIGAAASAGAHGIEVLLGDFFNQDTGKVYIDRTDAGIYGDFNGYFSNLGNITIGALSPVKDLVRMKYTANSSPLFQHIRGTVKGSGALSEGYVLMGGTLEPGNSPGSVTLESPGNVFAYGNISMEVNGAGAPGVDYDQIIALSNVNLADIALDLSVNYTPATGDRVTILTATSIQGTFESILGLPENWYVNYTPTAVILNYGSGPLPVSLVSFSGKKITESRNNLQWITADEKDFDRFDVQRSADAKTFETIGTVQGQRITDQSGAGPNGQVLHHYSFTDNAVGVFRYYRLKMVDLDGTFKYSRMISIENSAEHEVVGNFYPNPSSGEVFMDVFAVQSGRWTVTVFDAGGNRIAVEAYDLQKGMNKINLNRLSQGVNLVRFENGIFSEVRRVVKE